MPNGSECGTRIEEDIFAVEFHDHDIGIEPPSVHRLGEKK